MIKNGQKGAVKTYWLPFFEAWFLSFSGLASARSQGLALKCLGVASARSQGLALKC